MKRKVRINLPAPRENWGSWRREADQREGLSVSGEKLSAGKKKKLRKDRRGNVLSSQFFSSPGDSQKERKRDKRGVVHATGGRKLQRESSNAGEGRQCGKKTSSGVLWGGGGGGGGVGGVLVQEKQSSGGKEKE